jgi:hypothetical protein
MGAQPCRECGTRAKDLPRQRCRVCALRHAPIGDQVDAARKRLAMVPPELRLKRSKTVEAAAPAGTSFCAACQTFRDLVDFGKGATTCRACASAKSHATRTEKVYGITSEQYDELLKLQDHRCAICRARPKTKRLAVDHDHKTGAVLGLLCSRCNHDLKGAAWDSMAIAQALWHYMNTPPTSGNWATPEKQAPLSASVTAEKPVPAPFAVIGQKSAAAPVTPQPVARERTGALAAIHAMTPEGLELIGGTRDERGT